MISVHGNEFNVCRFGLRFSWLQMTLIDLNVVVTIAIAMHRGSYLSALSGQTLLIWRYACELFVAFMLSYIIISAVYSYNSKLEVLFINKDNKKMFISYF